MGSVLQIFSIHEDVLWLHLSICMRHGDHIRRKVDSIIDPVWIIWELIKAIWIDSNPLLLHVRSQVPVHEPPQVVYLLLEVRVLDDADQVLQRLYILQILLRLAKLGLKFLVEYLLQVLQDSLLCLTQVATGKWRTIYLVLLVIVAILYVVIVADAELALDLLNPDEDLVQILLDKTRRFLNSVDLLQTLRLQIFIRNDPLLHEVDWLLYLFEIGKHLLRLVDKWLIPVELHLHFVNLPL